MSEKQIEEEIDAEMEIADRTVRRAIDEMERDGFEPSTIFGTLITCGLDMLLATQCDGCRLARLGALRAVVDEMLGNETGAEQHKH
jgi:hypothetical protein